MRPREAESEGQTNLGPEGREYRSHIQFRRSKAEVRSLTLAITWAQKQSRPTPSMESWPQPSSAAMGLGNTIEVPTIYMHPTSETNCGKDSPWVLEKGSTLGMLVYTCNGRLVSFRSA